ncbi:MAG: response regulator transcription factor [Campylobacterales bacterium]|nr:response regulator transcription factor [Campylobacterales bacterium]
MKIRIKNLLDTPKENHLIQISKDITYDTEYEELTIKNEVIKLRKKERRLLTLLLQNINRSVDTEQIENYVWENEIRDHYPLRQLITEVRKKLNTEDNFIYADKGIGYRFEIKK